MDVQIAYSPQAFFLVFARVATIVGGAAMFGRAVVPARARIMLSFAIALVFTPLAPASWQQAAAAMNTVPELLFGIFSEILLGSVIVLVCDMFIAVCLVAGQIAGFSTSLSMAETIDPVNGASNSVLGRLLQLVFVMVILISNGHLLLIKLIFRSLQVVPPQLAWLNQDLLAGLIALGSFMFEWGVKLVAPVMAAILIVDVGFGLMTRMAPEFNIFFLSLPVRLVVGTMTLGFLFRFGGGMFSSLSEKMLAHCARILTG